MTVDRSTLHPCWVPGAGFHLQGGDIDAASPTSAEAVRLQIEAMRRMIDDGQVDRLHRELQGLLAMQARFDVAAERRLGASVEAGYPAPTATAAVDPSPTTWWRTRLRALVGQRRRPRGRWSRRARRQAVEADVHRDPGMR